MKTIKYGTITSTNDILKTFINGGLSEDTLITADAQTHGRGQRHRTWISQRNTGFYGSFYLHENLSHERAFLIAVMTLKAVLETYDIKPMLKLPNDIYVNHKKISGILIERYHETGKAIIGIGVNVSKAPLKTSTCINDVSPHTCDINTLTTHLKTVILNIKSKDTTRLFESFRAWVKSSPMHVYFEDKCADVLDIDASFNLKTTQGTTPAFSTEVHDGQCKL